MSRSINIAIIILLGAIFQGCSWVHWLIIKNPTEFTWTIEYVIKDERGIFNYQSWIQNEKEDIQSVQQKKIVTFKIKPNQSDTLGFTLNSEYNHYKNYRGFDEKFPRRTFLNVDTIFLTNGVQTFKFSSRKFKEILSKNSTNVAEINLKKVLRKE